MSDDVDLKALAAWLTEVRRYPDLLITVVNIMLGVAKDNPDANFWQALDVAKHGLECSGLYPRTTP